MPDEFREILIRPFMINSLFIITFPHRKLFVNNTPFQLIIWYLITKNQNRYFLDFLKKGGSKLISSTFERKYFKVKFTNTSLYLHSTNVLLFFTFQRVISSLSSVFREFIGDIFPLHTHTHTHIHKHTH